MEREEARDIGGPAEAVCGAESEGGVMKIEMVDPEGTLLRELQQPGITQESIALTYCFCMRQLGHKADYAKLNAAIRKKWSGDTALNRIKKMAWSRM